MKAGVPNLEGGGNRNGRASVMWVKETIMLLAEKLGSVANKSSSQPSRDAAGGMRSHAGRFATALFSLLVLFALYEGWQFRELNWLTAEHGIGYALGIIGGVMMLLLLLYPLRKRFAALRFMGAIKQWFRLHMIFGVLGPTLILFHANFGLGALNSNVALVCMLIVASSGLLGRYFYSRIHHGLYGSQATMHELQQASRWSQGRLVEELHYLPLLQAQLQDYEAVALKAGRGWLSIVTIPWLAISSQFACARIWRQCQAAIRAEITDAALQRQQLRQARKNLRDYFSEARKVAEFGFYARLFSLWHVLHLPLFVMMLVTGIIHVIAVHLY